MERAFVRRPLANMAAFKARAAFGFWAGDVLETAEGAQLEMREVLSRTRAPGTGAARRRSQLRPVSAGSGPGGEHRMRLAVALIALCALAACSEGEDADIVTDIETRLPADVQPATSAQSAEAAPPEPAPAPQAEASSAPSAPVEPVAEAAIEDSNGRQAAADLVTHYYRLLSRGAYRRAYGLWERDGTASGLSSEEFAQTFEEFSELRAEVGLPDRIDAGAGNRWARVPVRVTGRLAAGNRPFVMRGFVTVHRNGAIPGTTAEERSWRIHEIDVTPRPAEAEPEPSPVPTTAATGELTPLATPVARASPTPIPSPTTSPAPTAPASPTPEAQTETRSLSRYRCVDGTQLVVRFASDRERVAVSREGETVATLARQEVGSGMLYTSEGYTLQARGDALTFTARGEPPIPCTLTE
ncbi:MliC family protein [Sphingosinithalassobacter sp. LHW66-3]|uniref:MliC family protein n=1 Tax=Sphingosinithalassobacter sp. LHW66-3 TaxID=3424718 RepID=UPI003D6B8E60